MNRLVTAASVTALLLALGACGNEPDASETAQAPVPNETVESSAPAATGTASADAPAPAPVAGAETVAAKMEQPAAFLQCRTCHGVEPDARGAGPTMHGVFGRKAGSVENFPYSPALRDSGLTWDRESLDTWLQAPVRMVPGTRMVLSVPNADQRKAIIDYLETLK